MEVIRLGLEVNSGMEKVYLYLMDILQRKKIALSLLEIVY